MPTREEISEYLTREVLGREWLTAGDESFMEHWFKQVEFPFTPRRHLRPHQSRTGEGVVGEIRDRYIDVK